MMRRTPIVVVAVVTVVAAAIPAQEEVIQDDRPLPSRGEPDRDLTADDFRDRESADRGPRLELILGCLFLVLVLVISGLRRGRRES